MRVSIQTKVDLKELAHELVGSVPEGQLLKFIKEIDETIADWEFTRALVKHYQKMGKRLEKVDEHFGAPEK